MNHKKGLSPRLSIKFNLRNYLSAYRTLIALGVNLGQNNRGRVISKMDWTHTNYKNQYWEASPSTPLLPPSLIIFLS